jgi:hypothetical protein
MRKPIKKKPVEERFWDKVNKNTGTDCWHFTGAILKNGYGQFGINYKMVYAHRFAYELHKDPIPEGMIVMHSCDNRKCVNIDHLSLGTQLDNMRDMVKKNRGNKAKGSLSGKSKLTEDQILLIKNKLNLGETQINIAKEFQVRQTTISRIKRGEIWSHVQIN